MIEESKGSSQLAIMADTLPAQARVCLALLAASIALNHLRTSPEFSLALGTLTLALMWQEGKPVTPDELGEALEAEESGVAFAILRAKERSEQEFLAWCVFDNAIAYCAYHAFCAVGRQGSGSIGEVTEMQLDDLDKDLRTLDPSSMALMTRAATYLKQHPSVTLAQLKAQISKQ
jgi:immunity protein Imm6 of predicted polymorphic toxin system